MTYPVHCIRGIPNNSFLNDDGTVGSHLFHFKLDQGREDGFIEQSINWEDDDLVVQFTLQQTKSDGDIQFKAGVVVIPRDEIDRLNARPTIEGLLGYERQPLENNPYHGNILLRSNTTKKTMRLIAAGLALAVSSILPREIDL